MILIAVRVNKNCSKCIYRAHKYPEALVQLFINFIVNILCIRHTNIYFELFCFIGFSKFFRIMLSIDLMQQSGHSADTNGSSAEPWRRVTRVHFDCCIFGFLCEANG